MITIVVGIRVWQSNLPVKVVDLNKLLQIRVNYDNLGENYVSDQELEASNRLKDRGIYVNLFCNTTYGSCLQLRISAVKFNSYLHLSFELPLAKGRQLDMNIY